jgi:hypothetical protein
MGSTKIETPSVPTAPSVGSNIAEWVKYAPQIFALQQQYAPQEAAQQVELAQKYAGQLGEAYKSAQEAMYPEEAALNKQLTKMTSEGLSSDVPDWMQQEYLSNLRANMGTNVGSPISADYTSRGLLQQKKDWQDYYTNLGLAITNRQPVYSAQSPSYSNYMSSWNPSTVMSYNSSTYSPYVSAWQNQYNTNAQLASQPGILSSLGNVGGNLLGTFSGMATYGLGKKWGWF